MPVLSPAVGGIEGRNSALIALIAFTGTAISPWIPDRNAFPLTPTLSHDGERESKEMDYIIRNDGLGLGFGLGVNPHSPSRPLSPSGVLPVSPRPRVLWFIQLAGISFSGLLHASPRTALSLHHSSPRS